MASDDQILSKSMQSEQRKPTYRVTGVDPKGGDIDEQFALIETEFGYGAPGSDPSTRKISVGDSLPEGEVTEITADGIRVIPDEGPEFIIPLGGRQGYTPPVREKKIEPFYSDDPFELPYDRFMGNPAAEALGIFNADAGEYGRETAKGLEELMFKERRIEEARQKAQDFMDYIATSESGMLEAINQRARALREAAQDQGKFYDTDDPSEIYDSVQSDFADAQENQRVLESLDTGDGRNMLFQDDDGNLSSYYVDEEGDAIRMEPDPDTSKIYGDYRYSAPSLPVMDSSNFLIDPYE